MHYSGDSFSTTCGLCMQSSHLRLASLMMIELSCMLRLQDLASNPRALGKLGDVYKVYLAFLSDSGEMHFH